MSIKSCRETAHFILKTGKALNVPDHILPAAEEGLHILDAATTLADARIAARGCRLAKLPEKPTRFGAHLGDKWWLTFYWKESDAVDVDVEFRA